MKKFYLGFLKLFSFSVLIQLTLVSSLEAQQLNRASFVIFGVGGVQFSSSNTLTGAGSVGSNTLVNSTGGLAFPANIHSGGKITLGNGNTVAGKTTAANGASVTGNILFSGSSAVFNGDIVVKGAISISGATVASTAKIYQPSGAAYIGPTAVTKALLTNQLPVMPVMPTITTFTAGIAKVNTAKTNAPDNYGDVVLTGSKTLTLSPGVFYFNSLSFTNTNQVVFDFTGNPTGKFFIYIKNNALLDKVGASFKGLPAGSTNNTAAERIYTEVQGNGGASGTSFQIANGSSSSKSKWLGTVYAANGNINIGSGTGNTDLTGALWSAKQVIINSGVNTIYSPLLVECVSPTAAINNGAATANIPCDQTSIQLTGSTNISGATYTWTTLDDKGNIVPDTDGNPATVSVTTAGKYILSVTNSDGCTATDDISVTSCVNDAVDANPFKVYTVVDARLTKLSTSSDYKRTPYLFTFNGTDSSRVLIEAILTDNSIATATSALTVLGSLGFNTENYGPDDISNNAGYYIITGFFPVANLDEPALENPSLFKYIRAVTPPITFAEELPGTYNTLGDSAMGSRSARKGYDISGASFKDASGISKPIKIGVLSDSYNKKQDANIDAGNNDLPNIGTASNPVADVELPDGDYPFSFAKSDEGRAMLQIVHDVAPGAKLAFRTGFVSEGDMADGIRKLRTAGCNIIVDDITYATTPYFKEGLVTKAVKEVTTESNVIYFTSAGNFGNKSFEGSFSPSLQNGKAIPLSGTDTLQSIKLNGTGVNNYMIVLQWNDEFYSSNFGGSTPTGAAYDLDIYLTDYTGKNILGYNQVNTGSDPLEILPFTVTDKTTVYLKIVKAGGPLSGPSVAVKYIIFRGNAEIVNNPNPNPTTIIGHASSNAAITVGAVQFNLTPAFGVAPANIKIESFSSWGGPINNTDNRKPDISAPDGVNTSVDLDGNFDRPIKNLDGSVYINLPAPGYNAFFGTSAAAPHAAGLAALLMEARSKFNYTNNPNYTVYTPATMKAVMKSTATNIVTTNEQAGGFDFQSGSGLLDAYKALLTEGNPTPIITKIVSITTTDPPVVITTGPNAGKIKIVLVVEGDYLVSDSYLKIGTTTVIPESIDLATKTIVAYIEPFTGNPLVSVCSPASSTSGIDGQCSVPKNILDQARTVVQIKARDANKYYGQDLPAFGYDFQIKLPTESNFGALNVLPDGLTLADLGLTKIDPVSGAVVSTVKFNSSASSTSNASSTAYSITPSIEGFDPVPIEKAKLYDYQFVNGFLTINRLKVKITPEDQTITYGQEPQKVTFRYESADGVPLLNDPITGKNVLDDVKTEHNLYLDQTDAYALVRGDLALLAGNPILYDNLAMMITEAGIAQARLNGGGARANGGGARANVVDVTPEALENFFLSRANILNGGGARANGIPYEDATWSSNGGGARANGGGARANAVVNGDAMINGFVIFNGLPNNINTYGTANGIRYVSGGARANGGGARANGTTRANYILFDPIPNTTTVRANVVTNGVNYSFADISLPNGGGARANVCEDCLLGGYEISNGAVRANGESVVNTELFSGISNSNVAVLVNDLDIKNGEIPGYKSINLFTGLTATNNGKHKIIPGAFLPANNNYDVTYGMGELTVTKAPMTLKADDQLGKTYGDAVTFSATATEYIYDMETDYLDNASVVFPGAITYDVYNGPTKVVGTIYPVLAGSNKYTIKPVYAEPANYVVTPLNGDMTIVPANQIITWNTPSNITYGTKLSSTQLNASVTGVTGGSATGALTYTPGTGTLLAFGPNTLRVVAAATSNYLEATRSVIITVDRADLSVSMGQPVYYFTQGSSLPAITSTISGLATGESVSNNTYITSDGVTVTSSLAAGVYTIKRNITVSNLPTIGNYNILTTSSSTATLYVNPSGGNTKAIRPVLECIEPDGSNYRAKYSWTNGNTVPLYVPLGTDNKIILSAGAVVYSGTPPEVFPPGSGTFYIGFNGVKITWFISSIEKTKKTSSSSDATSTSNKCSSGGRANDLARATETDVVIRETIYPNPANNQVFIEGDFSKVSEKDIMIVDVIGRQMKPASIQKLSSRRMQINISNLFSSQYFITVNTATGKKVYKFIKL